MTASITDGGRRNGNGRIEDTFGTELKWPLLHWAMLEAVCSKKEAAV